jgi:hypothetical protein
MGNGSVAGTGGAVSFRGLNSFGPGPQGAE